MGCVLEPVLPEFFFELGQVGRLAHKGGAMDFQKAGGKVGVIDEKNNCRWLDPAPGADMRR